MVYDVLLAVIRSTVGYVGALDLREVLGVQTPPHVPSASQTGTMCERWLSRDLGWMQINELHVVLRVCGVRRYWKYCVTGEQNDQQGASGLRSLDSRHTLTRTSPCEGGRVADAPSILPT